jgi:hypothetical protein
MRQNFFTGFSKIKDRKLAQFRVVAANISVRFFKSIKL